MPIYMQIKGIEGPVTEKNHIKWISVDECKFDVTRTVTEGTGAAKNREFKAPVVSVINFKYKVDDATGPLAKWSMGEPAKGEVVVHFLRTGEDGYDVYMEYKLAQAILSKLTFTADNSPEERGVVEFSISFLSIEIKFTEYSEDAKPKAGPTVAYNLRAGTKAYVA